MKQQMVKGEQAKREKMSKGKREKGDEGAKGERICFHRAHLVFRGPAAGSPGGDGKEMWMLGCLDA